ncbi:hypothetical protein ACFFQF_33720 [Haladaptatus pallidirubidus]|uniref:Uncharacterized protein n=1 Tax=Haladaptatus pallidirubidus TaxID=1008152 RepID=A0AAV3UQJ6_9EURY|nr:hypothetical protein [Haladaptatus pallidirubidus]
MSYGVTMLTSLVGSADLGELVTLDVPILPGFTATAYGQYLTTMGLTGSISRQLDEAHGCS